MELGATALVVLGLGALLVATRIVWRAVRRKPEEVKIWGQLNMTEAGTSVYSVRRRDVLRSPEIASVRPLDCSYVCRDPKLLASRPKFMRI